MKQSSQRMSHRRQGMSIISDLFVFLVYILVIVVLMAFLFYPLKDKYKSGNNPDALLPRIENDAQFAALALVNMPAVDAQGQPTGYLFADAVRKLAEIKRDEPSDYPIQFERGVTRATVQQAFNKKILYSVDSESTRVREWGVVLGTATELWEDSCMYYAGPNTLTQPPSKECNDLLEGTKLVNEPNSLLEWRHLLETAPAEMRADDYEYGSVVIADDPEPLVIRVYAKVEQE